MLAIAAAAVALNVPVVAPGATVTDAGTVREPLLLESVRVEPPAGAAVFKVTEQPATPLPERLMGVHETEERRGTAMIPPAVENDGNCVAVGDTPIAFEMPIDTLPALGARVTSMFATTPSVITSVFNPLIRQVNRPGEEAHEIVFPPAAADAPAIAAIAEI